MKTIDRLLRMARERRGSAEQWQRWEGRFYDDLTAEERVAYVKYWSVPAADVKAFEEIAIATGGTLHFELMKRPTPPTPEEHQKIINEIEAQITKLKDREGVPEL